LSNSSNPRRAVGRKTGNRRIRWSGWATDELRRSAGVGVGVTPAYLRALERR